MAQAGQKRIDLFKYCRSRAFRAGYEDGRTGAAPRFGEWGKYGLAYEDGRQVAAFLAGTGGGAGRLPSSRALTASQELEIVKAVLTVQPRRRAAA